MKKSHKFFATTIITGLSAATGAIIYKINKDRKTFTKEKWDNDISKRYLMADNLIRDGELVGKDRNEIIELLGINGLRCNTKDCMEYYLSTDTSEPKLLILDYKEDDKVVKCTACL